MSWDIFKKIDDVLCQFNLKEIVFTGGEPALWPFLSKAINECVKISRIRVLTNGYNVSLKDFGEANVIQVSDYGAINRLDIYKLKKAGGRKVKVQMPVHWHWDRTVENELPGRCGCTGYSFADDKVWPCAMAAVMDTENGVPIKEIARLDIKNVFNQELCKNCLVNKKNRQSPKPVLQIGFWEGRSLIL